jgi:hypothetical protein
LWPRCGYNGAMYSKNDQPIRGAGTRGPVHDRTLHVRMTDEDVYLLAKVALYEGLTVSEWVRRAVRRAYVLTAAPKRRRR